jgi:RNA polymerase sigma factor (sigma-70 family)
MEARSIAHVAGTDEETLIARGRRGDRDAFALLIEPRAARLLRIARAILGSEEDSYEATQEALVAAWINLPSLRHLNRFDAWLTRMLVNKCRDAERRRRRTVALDLTEFDVAVADTTQAAVALAPIQAAFDRLSVDERTIIVLHHLQDLPLARIASQLQIPLGTAKSRLWAARRALERALEAES